jgi:hypothetical protein
MKINCEKHGESDTTSTILMNDHKYSICKKCVEECKSTAELCDLEFLAELDLAIHQGNDKWTAQLLDEEDEDGPVVIRDENGHDRLLMLQEDYHALKEFKE